MKEKIAKHIEKIEKCFDKIAEKNPSSASILHKQIIMVLIASYAKRTPGKDTTQKIHKLIDEIKGLVK